MPIFAALQVIINRAIIVVVAILAAFGLGSVSNPIAEQPIQEDLVKEVEELIVPAEELPILPEETIAPIKEEVITVEKEPTNEIVVETTKEEVVVNTEPVIVHTELPLTFSQINTETAKALVNVICSQNINGAVNPITGSGVIVDPRGVVITNAHVAQFFLLKDYPIENSLECTLRTGSPARATYTAELLYISPEWVRLHANDIKNSEPKGTGEHDYAFLRITGRTDPNAKLPDMFPFIPIDINGSDIETGDQVLAAAYPAGFLGSISIQKDLYSVSSVATIGEKFTFLANTIDLFSIGGTVVSQGGSSGGAIVSSENKLIGVIVTSTKADTTAERDLRAITLEHINTALIENADTTIERLLSGDIKLTSEHFRTGVSPTLINIFLQILQK